MWKKTKARVVTWHASQKKEKMALDMVWEWRDNRQCWRGMPCQYTLTSTKIFYIVFWKYDAYIFLETSSQISKFFVTSTKLYKCFLRHQLRQRHVHIHLWNSTFNTNLMFYTSYMICHIYLLPSHLYRVCYDVLCMEYRVLYMAYCVWAWRCLSWCQRKHWTS